MKNLFKHISVAASHVSEKALDSALIILRNGTERNLLSHYSTERNTANMANINSQVEFDAVTFRNLFF